MKSDAERIEPGVEESIELCAEKGWRVSLYFRSGESFEGAFITATDENKKVIVVERPGERHLKPRIVYLNELQSVEVIWKK